VPAAPHAIVSEQMLEYPVGQSEQHLLIEDPVIEHFRRWQQRRWYQKEAGGQLFAILQPRTVIVTEATGPRTTDKRSRFGYVADRHAEREEIKERYGRGLHYVGDWHTHHERVAQPSSIDITSIRECVTKSEHMLNAFVLIVVGTATVPDCLSVIIHDGRQRLTLIPQRSTDKDTDPSSHVPTRRRWI